MDPHTLLVGFARNLGAVALVVFLFSWAINSLDGRLIKGAVIGALFAAGGTLSMLDPVPLAPGVILDARTPLLALAYPYGGLSGAIVAAGLLAVVRLWVGGAGALPGVVGIACTAGIGIGFSLLTMRRLRPGFLRSSMLGLASSLSTLTVLMLPGAIAVPLLRDAFAPIALSNIIAVVLMDGFLRREQRRFHMLRMLETQASTDPLTGLSNRRAFDENARGVLARGGVVSFVLLDVDHFKKVNDTYGHAMGDEVLKEVATLVRASVRGTDVVARYGGEEIAVLLEGRDEASALKVAEIVRSRIELHVFAAGIDDVRITASLGTATTTAQLRDLPLVMQLADEALYAAKRKGRNRVELAFAR